MIAFCHPLIWAQYSRLSYLWDVEMKKLLVPSCSYLKKLTKTDEQYKYKSKNSIMTRDICYSPAVWVDITSGQDLWEDSATSVHTSIISKYVPYQNICQICHIIEIYKLAWSNIWAQWQAYFIFGPFFHLFSFKFTIFIQYGQIWFYQSFLYLMISIIMLPYPVFRLYFCNLWDCFGSSAIQFIWVCLPAHYFFTYIINGKGDPHSVRVALNRVIIGQQFDTKN